MNRKIEHELRYTEPTVRPRPIVMLLSMTTTPVSRNTDFIVNLNFPQLLPANFRASLTSFQLHLLPYLAQPCKLLCYPPSQWCHLCQLPGWFLVSALLKYVFFLFIYVILQQQKADNKIFLISRVCITYLRIKTF